MEAPTRPPYHPRSLEAANRRRLTMKHLKTLAVAAALCLVAMAAPASADPVKNIVLVHGAWVDASGWKPVYEILSKDGFHVTMVQEPETSFADDVAATRRILDLQDGPTLLVGHSYGGSIITEAGVHPEGRRPRLRRRARPRRRRGRGRPRQEDAERAGQDRGCHQEDARRLHLSQPGRLPQAVRARPAARAGGVRGALAGAGRGQGVQHAADRSRLEDQAELGHRRRRATRSSTPISSAGTTRAPTAAPPRSRAPATPSTNPIRARSRP